MKSAFDNIIRNCIYFFVFVVLIFGVAAIRYINSNSTNITDTSTPKTTSLIESIIPTTKSDQSNLSEIENLFKTYSDTLVEDKINSYIFKRYMSNFSYTYNDLVKAYISDMYYIILYDDSSGILRYFIFNKSEFTHIKTIKTIKPIGDYPSSIVIIDSSIYYIDALTERDEENNLYFKNASIKFFDLYDHETYEYISYEFNENIIVK